MLSVFAGPSAARAVGAVAGARLRLDQKQPDQDVGFLVTTSTVMVDSIDDADANATPKKRQCLQFDLQLVPFNCGDGTEQEQQHHDDN